MNSKKIITDHMEQSMQGTSQFVEFQASMEQSMCGSSQKIHIDNASTVNRLQLQKDLKAYKQLKGNNSKFKQAQIQEEQNQFLNVGKWNKQKKSSIAKGFQNQVKIVGIPVNPKAEVVQKVDKPVSKWQKKKSMDSSNRSQTSFVSNTNKNSSEQVKKNNIPQIITKKHQQKVIEDIKKQQFQQELQEQEDQQEQQDGQQQDQDEQQQEQQEEEEQQQEQEQEQEQEDQEDQEDENDQQNEQDQQQQEEEQKQQIQDKFATGNQVDQFQQSSEAVKTQTVNTSAMNNTLKPTKWNKKKAPLQTMTKYQVKQITQNEAAKKGYYSRLNSAKVESYKGQDQITEDILCQNSQWNHVQKILLRLKLLLT